MQLYGSFCTHLTLVIKAERLLRLTEQFSFLRLIFIEGQTTTIEAFKGQFTGFFRRVRAQFRGNVARATGENGDSEHQGNSQ